MYDRTSTSQVVGCPMDKNIEHTGIHCRTCLYTGIGLLCVGIAGVLMLRWIAPQPGSIYPGCHFHDLTGLHCAGCGLTRAMGALVRGHWWQAMAYNLFSIPFAIVAVLLTCQVLVYGWKGRRLLPIGWEDLRLRHLFILLALLFTFLILRNLPAFSFLTPHKLELQDVKNGASHSHRSGRQLPGGKIPARHV